MRNVGQGRKSGDKLKWSEIFKILGQYCYHKPDTMQTTKKFNDKCRVCVKNYE